jgi:hypothetical protein
MATGSGALNSCRCCSVSSIMAVSFAASYHPRGCPATLAWIVTALPIARQWQPLPLRRACVAGCKPGRESSRGARISKVSKWGCQRRSFGAFPQCWCWPCLRRAENSIHPGCLREGVCRPSRLGTSTGVCEGVGKRSFPRRRHAITCVENIRFRSPTVTGGNPAPGDDAAFP